MAADNMSCIVAPLRTDDLASADFICAMRRSAAGINVVTTCDGISRHGATVSAMSSVSADPPALLVCLYNASALAAALIRSEIFAVNVLSSDQIGIAERFAGRTGINHKDRFETADWTTLTTGAPILRPCNIAFDCRLSERISIGTHTIFVGRVASVQMGSGSPLVYTDRDYHSLDTITRDDVAHDLAPCQLSTM